MFSTTRTSFANLGKSLAIPKEKRLQGVHRFLFKRRYHKTSKKRSRCDLVKALKSYGMFFGSSLERLVNRKVKRTHLKGKRSMEGVQRNSRVMSIFVGSTRASAPDDLSSKHVEWRRARSNVGGVNRKGSIHELGTNYPMELEGTDYPAKEKSHVARCAGAELENGTNNFERKICENGIHEDNKLQIDDHSLEVKTIYGIKEG